LRTSFNVIPRPSLDRGQQFSLTNSPGIEFVSLSQKEDLEGFSESMPVYRNSLKKYSRDLRKNMVEAEIYVWSNIIKKQINGLQWYRQRVIGDYIVDFYCPVKKLVIEIDDSQHYSEEMLKADAKRVRYLQSYGITVLRFNNDDVMRNIEGVFERILENL
jgi:very-short-patch-repair endonuclease